MADVCLICRGATIQDGGVHPRSALMRWVTCFACGRYFFSVPEARDAINGLGNDDRFTLSALTRQALDSGAPMELKRDNLIIEAAPRLALSDRLDRLLLLLDERASDYLSPVVLNKDHDFPLVWARGPAGMNALVTIAKQEGLLRTDPDHVVLTPKGWARVWFDPSLNDA